MLIQLGSLALHNLLRAKARLLMTAGGVLVGTSAVIILIALTFGLQAAAEVGIGQNASLTEINVYPNWQPVDSGVDLPQLTPGAVRSFWDIPGVAAVIPMVSMATWGELIAGDFSGGGQVLGVDPRLLPYLGVTAARGELSLNPGQVIIGGTIGQNFYDPSAEEWTPAVVDVMATPLEMRFWDSMGTTQREIDLEVAAELSPGGSYDYVILMPIQDVLALNEWVRGEPINPETFVFDQVTVRATSRETAGAVVDAIKAMGYGAGGMVTFLNELNSFFTTMRIILGSVGGVALLVAAFGVANTMTMAILERTREIGVMKAIGATDRDVLSIFLIEAALVGLVGGSSGVLIAYGVQNVVNQALQNMPRGEGGGGIMFLPIDLSAAGGSLLIIPGELALFALVLATSVGILAGFYPALRAARMTTVAALKSD
ncbi:ABC transporter permease [Anaerolineae bacterium CFX9]|jgi:putative ABC transport system permease protein|nr:FtsX-like permease family protein [Kamptonema cortianum]MDL1901877.1 ABC transporter permease [Anaerolineae bacterium CFX9]